MKFLFLRSLLFDGMNNFRSNPLFRPKNRENHSLLLLTFSFLPFFDNPSCRWSHQVRHSFCRPCPPCRAAHVHRPLTLQHRRTHSILLTRIDYLALFTLWSLCCAQMFTNDQRQKERTGKYGSPRQQYLQELVAGFQNASSEETKEKIVANLGNFAYDPYNYTFLRQLNVLELFLDCLTEPNERLVEFAVGGICNACADPTNAAVVIQCGGIPLVIQCLSSPVRNTVNYALGSLYYLCNATTEDEILKPEILDAIKRFAEAGAVNVGFSNLAQAFLDRHVSKLK